MVRTTSAQAPLEPLALEREITPFVNSAFALALDRGNSRIAIGGYRGVISVISTESLEPLHRIAPNGGMVLALRFDATGSRLLVSGDPKRLRIYRTDTWELERTIDLPFRCGFFATHPEHPIVALAGVGAAVLFFNFETGEEIGRMDQNLERSFDLEFARDGNSLLAVTKTKKGTVSPNNLIAIDTSSLEDGKFTSKQPAFNVLVNFNTMPHSLTRSPSRSELALITPSDRAMAIDANTLRVVREYSGEFQGGKGLAFFDDETLVASSGQAFVRLGKENLAESIRTPTDHSQNCNHLVFDVRNQRLFASHARARNQLTVWRFRGATKRIAHATSGFAGPIAAMPTTPKPRLNDKSKAGEANDALAMDSSPSENSISPKTQSERAQGELAKPGAEPRPVFIPEDYPERTWTDKESGRTVQAHLVGIDGNEVLLRLPNASETIVARTRLTKTDQEFLSDIESKFPTRRSFDQLADDPIALGLAEITAINIEVLDSSEDIEQRKKFREKIPVWLSVPDGRGSFFLATTKGLAKYNPELGVAVLAATPPDLTGTVLPEVEQIEELVVDRFGRVLVRFQRDWQVYRWNGFDWVNLWSEMDGGIRSLFVSQKNVFAVLSQQPFNSIWKIHKPLSILVRLEPNDRWINVPIRVDAQEITDVEDVSPYDDGRLLVIRRNEHPSILKGDKTSLLDESDLVGNELNRVIGAVTHRPVIAENGAIYFLRKPPKPKNFGIVEMKRIDDSGEFVWDTSDKFWDANKPSRLARDRLGRILVGFRSGELFVVEDDNRLQPLSFSKTIARRWDLSKNVEPKPIRDPGLVSRLTQPFIHDRTWTATNGSSINATCMQLNKTHVRLRTADDKQIDVALSELSDSDQQFLSNLNVHRQASIPSQDRLQVVHRQRTRSGSFTNWNQMPEEEKAKVLPRIIDVSTTPSRIAGKNIYFATTRGLETWDGSKLDVVSLGPEAVRNKSEGQLFWQQVLALSDGTALGIFKQDPRVFRFTDEWKATRGTEQFALSRMTRIGNRVLAFATLHEAPRNGPKWGIATFDLDRGWRMLVGISPIRSGEPLVGARKIVSIDESKFGILWWNSGTDPGTSVVTLHDFDRSSTVDPTNLQPAFQVIGDYSGPNVFWHGLLMLRSKESPARLARWCLTAPISSHVIATHHSYRELGNSNDLTVASDGGLWSIRQGRVTRADRHGTVMIDIDDPSASKVDVAPDGTAFAQGNYLTVIRHSVFVDRDGETTNRIGVAE